MSLSKNVLDCFDRRDQRLERPLIFLPKHRRPLPVSHSNTRSITSQFGANSNATRAISIGGAPILATETNAASIKEDDVSTRLIELFDQGTDV